MHGIFLVPFVEFFCTKYLQNLRLRARELTSLRTNIFCRFSSTFFLQEILQGHANARNFPAASLAIFLHIVRHAFVQVKIICSLSCRIFCRNICTISCRISCRIFCTLLFYGKYPRYLTCEQENSHLSIFIFGPASTSLRNMHSTNFMCSANVSVMKIISSIYLNTLG